MSKQAGSAKKNSPINLTAEPSFKVFIIFWILKSVFNFSRLAPELPVHIGYLYSPSISLDERTLHTQNSNDTFDFL